MALTADQAETVVRKSIRDAGGTKGPHQPQKTLDQAGLIKPEQRQQFRRRTKPNARDFDHDIDTRFVPFSAGTTVGEAQKAVKDNATAL
jgi:hypothetical protein